MISTLCAVHTNNQPLNSNLFDFGLLLVAFTLNIGVVGRKVFVTEKLLEAIYAGAERTSPNEDGQPLGEH